jgi:hypothetical protein
MEKAYDLKGLVEISKAEGLELAEESAKVALKAVFKWLKESAELSATPVDNLAVPFYPLIEAKILEVTEKINPQG